MGKPEYFSVNNAFARTRFPRTTVWAALAILSLGLGLLAYTGFARERTASSRPPTAVCTQAEPLLPHSALRYELDELYASPGFLDHIIDRLRGAVRIKTVTYDDMGSVEEDERWDPFHDFHDYLHAQFPLVHSTLSLDKFDTLSLVYTWPGSDTSLSPILLAAHQDVVPVENRTIDQWLEGPFSGAVENGWLWGRGSCDDKAGLIGIMMSLETLIDHGFTPRRTIVLAFGHDEEIGGSRETRVIAQHLLERYGQNSFAMLVDEGGVFGDVLGATVAYPGVAEKGYLNVHVEVDSPGGHSSIPPNHTSIGMLSALLVELEDHPEEPRLTRDSTTFATLQCLAEHAPDMDAAFRDAIKEAATSDPALSLVEQQVVHQFPIVRALLQTTQAVTVVGGGVKANALPEQAWALVNHRIATHSSVQELQSRIARLAVPVARRFGASLDVFGSEDLPGTGTAPNVTMRISASEPALEPSPRTPTGYGDAAYRLFSGTIRAVLQGLSEREVVVVPGMPTGNTDTKHYWALTRHIFRYYAFSAADVYGQQVHTVNEAIRVKALPGIMQFYSYLILNADESDALE